MRSLVSELVQIALTAPKVNLLLTLNTNVALCPEVIAPEVGVTATATLGESAVSFSGIRPSRPLVDRPAHLQPRACLY